MENGKVDGNRPRRHAQTHTRTPARASELESVRNFARPLYRSVGASVCVSLVIVANLVTNKHILYV